MVTNSDSVDDDIIIEGDTEEKTTPFHKKLMRDSAANDPDVSSAVKLAMAVRLKRKEAENARKDKTDYKDQRSEKITPARDARVQGHWKNVVDLSRLRPSTVATILKRSVIYDDGDVIAINKPYGLPVHGGPRITNNVSALLPHLAMLLRSQQKVAMETPSLHLIHRLDKETTGVMLLARSEVTAKQLHQLFFQRKMLKKYLVITVGVPEPLEGIIDIPLIDKAIAGKNRMVVKPEIGDIYEDILGQQKRNSKGITAVTNFRVVSSTADAALVELIPETGVKHQLRVHMSQGLGCTILGDHKYSHFNKLAPQILPRSILRKFGIHQAKVRKIPMHLLARQLRIPDYKDGRALSISVKLPLYFAKTLQKLKLTIP